MMHWWLVVEFGVLLGGLVLAVAWWLVRRRGLPRLGDAVGVFTLIAGLLGILAGMLVRVIPAVWMLMPPNPQLVMWFFDYRYLVPLGVALVGQVVLAFPFRSRGGRGVAELAPRGALRFTHARWLIAPGAVLGLILLITIVAGATSQPDPTTGRYDMYVVEIADGHTMGTAIYGWFYSLPALVAIALIGVTAIGSLESIARPPLALDHDGDAQIRALRSRNVITLATGALLIHLGMIFQSLAGTASLAASVSTDIGRITLSTPVAAMVPVFTGASFVAAVLGVAMAASVALTTVGARNPTRTLVAS